MWAVRDVLVLTVLDVVADKPLPNESPVAASPRFQKVLKNVRVSLWSCRDVDFVYCRRTIPEMGVWNQMIPEIDVWDGSDLACLKIHESSAGFGSCPLYDMSHVSEIGCGVRFVPAKACLGLRSGPKIWSDHWNSSVARVS